MAACIFRIAALIAAVICLQKFASAALVITFYEQDDDVWMSLSGTGTVPSEAGATADQTINFLNFDGNPFPAVGDSPYRVSDSTLNLHVNGQDFSVAAVQMIGEGTGQSDLSLIVPRLGISQGDAYTFSGAARLEGLHVGQLVLGAYNAPGGGPGAFDTLSTPEPASLALMGVGALGLYVSGRRRRKHRPAPAPDDPATLV